MCGRLPTPSALRRACTRRILASITSRRMVTTGCRARRCASWAISSKVGQGGGVQRRRWWRRRCPSRWWACPRKSERAPPASSIEQAQRGEVPGLDAGRERDLAFPSATVKREVVAEAAAGGVMSTRRRKPSQIPARRITSSEPCSSAPRPSASDGETWMGSAIRRRRAPRRATWRSPVSGWKTTPAVATPSSSRATSGGLRRERRPRSSACRRWDPR